MSMENRPIIKSTLEKPASTLVGVNSNGNPITVLVIDDEVTHRKIMIQILRSIGFEIVGEATNGEEGLIYYKNLKPQLVTLDFHMPRMNGLSTLKELKKVDSGVVVLMSTSLNTAETIKEILQAGVADFIMKPFERITLIEKLTKIVKNYIQK